MMRRCLLPFALLATAGCMGLGAPTREVPPAALSVLRDGINESARVTDGTAKESPPPLPKTAAREAEQSPLSWTLDDLTRP